MQFDFCNTASAFFGFLFKQQQTILFDEYHQHNDLHMTTNEEKKPNTREKQRKKTSFTSPMTAPLQQQQQH
jgi:uncharacterized membrane protein YkgB